MALIVLTTFNAKYIHAAFGLRYLLANLGPLQAQARLLEFDLQQRPVDIVEAILAEQPRIVGIGVYIWNAALSAEVVALLKRVAPEVTIVLGGPEVSYETNCQPIVQDADYVITGEADLKFAELCQQLQAGQRPPDKILSAGLPDLKDIALPYGWYDDRDVAHRVIYVEASRGCPFTCEFCLSSLDVPVRQFPLEQLLADLERLLARGVQQFKFVDRTFNLNLNTSRAILEFFRERLRPGLFLHFEMIPDRLPDSLRGIIGAFPAGTLQFEVGIQTFDEAVAERIKRRQDYPKTEENLRFLRNNTGVHIHADLIAGLPGETIESFGRGFDRLLALRPHEIQVGILKRLRGTPIVRHDANWGMIYSPNPPYEVLKTRVVSFEEMQQIRRFARYWDLAANSGNFLETAPLLWEGAPSAFQSFRLWSDWLYRTSGRTHGIALGRLAELLFTYLIEHRGVSPEKAASSLWSDYQRAGRSDRPAFLREFIAPGPSSVATKVAAIGLKRQSRHVGRPVVDSDGSQGMTNR